MKTTRPFFLAVFLLIGCSVLAQDLGLALVLLPPYSGRVSDYTDLSENNNIFVDLDNPGRRPLSVYLRGRITRNGADFAGTDPGFRPSSPIRLAAGEMQSFDGIRLRDLNLNFRSEDITGVTSEQLAQIFADDALPEGEYQICIRAFNFANDRPLTINGEEEFCSLSFTVVQGGFPEIVRPEDGEEIDPGAEPEVLFEWSYNGTESGAYDLRYRIKLIDLTEQGVDPALATMSMFDPGVPVVYETDASGIFDFSYTYGFDPLDVPLVPGHQYALRVSVFEADELLTFRNNGHSQVHTFRYGREENGGGDCNDPNYSITATYPVSGDTIPFNFTPCIARVDPICDNYQRFDFDFNVAGGGRSYRRDDRNSWGSRGPVEYLRNLLGSSVTRERAAHFVFNLELEQNGAMGPLQPGETYDWSVSTTMESMGGNSYSGSTAGQSFVHGMPSPVPLSPANAARVAPGEVNLRWNTGREPATLVPEYLNLIRAQRTEVVGRETLGNVFETCVLQVARSNQFEPGNMVTGTKVDVRLNNPDQDPAGISAALFRELDHTISVVDTGDYFWRVVWLKRPDIPVGENGYLAAGQEYHSSPVFRFSVGDTPSTVIPDGPVADEEETECSSNCIVALPSNENPLTTLAVGDSVRLGKFTLVAKELTSSSGGTFAGAGEVEIPFLNNLRVLVDFTGLRVNAARQAFAGKAIAKQDPNPFNVLETLGADGETIPQLADSQLPLLNEFISSGERLASGFTGNRAIGMPIGIDQEFGERQVILGVMKMEFEATVAKMDIVCSLEIPEFDSHIGLGVGDWCFNPNGLGTDGRLFLAGDIPLNPGDDVVFSISGGADTTETTYLEFDCDGFKCLQLRGELSFDRSIVLPDTTVVTDPDARVEASLSVKLCKEDGWDFMLRAHLDAFIAPDMDNFVWKDSDLWFDLSDRENPTGMTVPTGYRWAGDAANARTRGTWKGIYIPQIMLKLPRDLAGSDPVEVGVDNFIIDFDPGALTFRVLATNLVGPGEAAIKGWGITVDTLYASLIQTRDLEVGISGKIEMPLTDEGEHLLYHAALNTAGLDLGISVDARNPLHAPIMAASLQLKPNTFIKVHLGFRDSSYVEARLNGEVSISGDNANDMSSSGSSPSMDMPGIKFENVYFHTGTGASSAGTWSPASPQKSAVGFPLQIDSIGLDFADWEHPGFFIKPRLTLMGDNGGISAAAMLHFYGALEGSEDSQQKIRLDRVELSEINLDVTISAVTLKGYIRWTESATVEEVSGGIDVTLPMGMRGKLECTFGTYRANETAAFGTRDYYSYWSVDGLVQFNPGLQIFSGIALYGLGGGVSYHMTPTTLTTATSVRGAPATAGGADRETDTPENEVRVSGTEYRRDFDVGIGLRFTVILGTFPKPDAFNMDVTLAAEFNNSGGLNFIQLRGDGYIMTDLADRGSDTKMLWATVDIAYRAPDEELHGTFDVFLDVHGVLVGNASNKRMVNAVIHVDPDMWYFYMGTYDDRGGIKLQVGDTELASLNSYVMVGHGVPAELPEIEDDQLRDLLYAGARNSGGGANYIDSDEASIVSDRSEGFSSGQGDLVTGKGFAFGTAFSMEAFLNPVPFYLGFRIALGMDALIAQVPEGMVCAETGERPGANGWRVAGQVYAGIWGELGIGVKIIRRFTIPLIQLAAGFKLAATVPNPNYFEGDAAVQYSVLGGVVSGRKTLHFEFGTECTLVSDDPLANIRVLEDIGPRGQQDVYAQAVARFNFPINQVLTLPRSMPDDGPPTFWRFRPYIEDWTLKSTTGTSVPCAAPVSMENGYAARLRPLSVLPEFTNLRTDIRLQFRNLSDGRDEIYIKENSSVPYREDSTAVFRSGARPDVIPPPQVRYSYPMNGQRFFLADVTNRRGVIAMTTGHEHLFYREREGASYDYVLRYIPLAEEGEPIDVPLTDLSGSDLNFQVPDNLLPETIYSCQLIRKRPPTQMEMMQDRFQATGVNVGSAITASLPPTLMMVRTNLSGGDYMVMQRTRKIDHSEVSNPAREFLLYKFYFRTSKFRSLDAKLASLNLIGKTPHNGLGQFGAVVRGNLEEHFDEFEVNGVWHMGTRVLSPMIKITPHLADDYFSYHFSRLYPRYARLMRVRTVDVNLPVGNNSYNVRIGLPGWRNVSLISAINREMDRGYRINPDQSWIINRLGAAEIGNASVVDVPAAQTSTATSPLAVAGLNVGNASASLPSGIRNRIGSGNITTSFLGGAPSVPSYNFGLVFRSPSHVQADQAAMANHVNWLNGLYLGATRRNGTVSIGMNGLAQVPADAFWQLSLREAIRRGNPSAFSDMEAIRLYGWHSLVAFTDRTPALPLGSEFAQRQSNTYRVRFNYRVSSLGAQSLLKSYQLNYETPANTVTGPF